MKVIVFALGRLLPAEASGRIGEPRLPCRSEPPSRRLNRFRRTGRRGLGRNVPRAARVRNVDRNRCLPPAPISVCRFFPGNGLPGEDPRRCGASCVHRLRVDRKGVLEDEQAGPEVETPPGNGLSTNGSVSTTSIYYGMSMERVAAMNRRDDPANCTSEVGALAIGSRGPAGGGS